MLVSEGIVKYSGDTLVSSLLKMSQTLVSIIIATFVSVALVTMPVSEGIVVHS